MRIKDIKIENFKGLKSLEIALNGKSAIIKGANGTGKTTIADAISWCLFGKSSNNLTDFGIRPVDGDNEADTAVTLTTTEGLKIKRILHEKWQKTKGTNEIKYKGTETICEWDEVPVSVTAFKQKVQELFPVGDEMFKLCTNPDAFFKLKWQAQREILIDIVGEPTAEQIGMEDFMKQLNGKSVDDFKASIAKQKKPIKEAFETIPARIDEASKLKKSVNPLDKEELDRVSVQLENLRNTKSGAENIKKQVSEIRKKISDLQNKKFGKEKSAYSEKLEKEHEASDIKKSIHIKETEIDGQKWLLSELEKKIENLRKEYEEVYDKQFENDGICPVCHQPYPADKMEEMLNAFNQQKAESLKRITESGVNIKGEIEAVNRAIKSMQAEIDEKRAELEKAESTLNTFKPADTSEEDAQIAALENSERELLQKFEEADNSRLVSELETRKAQLLSLVNVDEFNADIETRIEDLHRLQKEFGDQLAQLEKLEFQAKEYTQKLIECTENSINSLFERVKFKFANFTIDGGYIETCVATINGVEYNDVNTASQVNAGIEIINVLSRHYGIDAPIILDNRERVTEIRQCLQQVISLAVDKDCAKLTTQIL